MHVRIIVLSALFMSAIGQASAALSGYWDSEKVLQAILERNDVGDALKQQPIESISKGKAGYQFKSRDCTVNILVERRKASSPGPDSFQLRVGRGSCR